jgi:hypothetical protein
MILREETIWELADRMSTTMESEAQVFVRRRRKGMPPEWDSMEPVERGGSLLLSGDRVNLVVIAGKRVGPGEGVSEGTALSFEFPIDRVAGGSLLGATEQLDPYLPTLDATTRWLIGRGRFRWGRLPLIAAIAALLMALLFIGLVAVLFVTGRGEYPWLTVPFAAITGGLAIWSLVVEIRKLVQRDRERRKHSVIRP